MYGAHKRKSIDNPFYLFKERTSLVEVMNIGLHVLDRRCHEEKLMKEVKEVKEVFLRTASLGDS